VAKVMSRNNPVTLAGELPPVGAPAPDFLLTGTDLQEKSLKDYAGKKIILNIFPSIDTPVCAASTRKFDSEAEKLGNVVVLCVSVDLPFAHGRFCRAEGLKNVIPLSSLRNHDFGENYGVRLMEGPLAGLFARAVVVLDETGKVLHTELVPDISDEPNYEAALAAVR
jgi:thiol peroxidase